MPRIFIDGSSTAYGLWGGPAGGWGDRMKLSHMPDGPDREGKRPLWKVYNLAAPHRTINDILRQLPEFIRNYRRDETAIVSVVMVGQVESRYSSGSQVPDMPIGHFANALRRLAALTMTKNSQLILVGTTPVVADKVRAVGRLATRYDMEQRLLYDRMINEVSTKVGAPYVHIMRPLIEAQRAGRIVMDSDGLHPNALGHTLMYDRVHRVVAREVARLSRP